MNQQQPQKIPSLLWSLAHHVLRDLAFNNDKMIPIWDVNPEEGRQILIDTFNNMRNNPSLPPGEPGKDTVITKGDFVITHGRSDALDAFLVSFPEPQKNAEVAYVALVMVKMEKGYKTRYFTLEFFVADDNMRKKYPDMPERYYIVGEWDSHGHNNYGHINFQGGPDKVDPREFRKKLREIVSHEKNPDNANSQKEAPFLLYVLPHIVFSDFVLNHPNDLKLKLVEGKDSIRQYLESQTQRLKDDQKLPVQGRDIELKPGDFNVLEYDLSDGHKAIVINFPSPVHTAEVNYICITILGEEIRYFTSELHVAEAAEKEINPDGPERKYILCEWIKDPQGDKLNHKNFGSYAINPSAEDFLTAVTKNL